MFIAGLMLRNIMIAVTIQAVINAGRDGTAFRAAASASLTSVRGRIPDQKPSSKQARAGRIVSQFRNERLPLRMRMSWSNVITVPAMCRARRGQNMNHGATSSARKLNQTPAFKTAWGRK